jgi:hypothetical protein
MFFGHGFAALREASDLGESGLFSLTFGVLLISILLVGHGTKCRRAFWIAFALFGWIYLVFTLMPSIDSRLITTKVLAYLDFKLTGRSSVTFTTIGLTAGQVTIGEVTTSKPLGAWSGTTENFVKIGHSLFALPAGWLIGQLSRRLCRRSRSSEPSTAVDARGTAP